MRSHRVAAEAAAGESGAFISRIIVGMKYENVRTRSAITARPAASHHVRSGPVVIHAAARLASVSSVSGPVVTKAQTRNPTLSRVGAAAFQCAPPRSVVIQP